MNPQIDLQSKFFKDLVNHNGQRSIVDELMEVLNLKRAAVYKRMNGDTAMTTAELICVADHFECSLDTMFFQDQFISFRHPFMQMPTTKSIDFLELISGYLETLRSQQNSELTYMANELPFFYYISRKYIFNFLLSIWNHLHWEEGALNINESARLDEAVASFGKDITEYYDSHPVTEIWNSNMLSNLYQQIIFCMTIRAFNDITFVEKLMLDIQNLIQHLKHIAVEGIRKSYGEKEQVDLKIYLNEFGNYLDIILYSGQNFQSTFIGFDYPQFIVTKSDRFYQYANQWMQKIKKRSVLISSEGLQLRELFFIKMEKDFNDFKHRVDNLIKVYYE